MEKETRQFLFLFGCIGSRSLLAYLAYKEDHKDLLTWITTIIGIGLWIVYFFKLRNSGFEAGGKIWWNHLRPIHGTLYLLFAYFNHTGIKNSYLLLVIDVLLALLVYISRTS